MQYGLKKETVKKISAIFAKYEEVEEATIYGSRAKGNYKPGSDVDLTLNSGDEAPADWQNPTSIKFLTVENTSFNFALALNKKKG